MSGLEERADVDSLERLHEERRQLLIRLAPLKAMHGPFGLFDAKRKQMVEAMKVKARVRLQNIGGKVTDAIIDAEAHCDEQYTAWLDQQLTERVEYVKMDGELDRLNDLIRNREISLQVYNGELRLAR